MKKLKMPRQLASLLFKVFSLLPGSSRQSIFSRCRVYLLSNICRSIGSGCLIRSGVIVNLPRNLSVGSNSGLGFRAIISCEDSVTIGDRVLMGADVIIYTSNHVWSERDATYIGQGLETSPVSIGSDTWIGARSIILPGVSIGQGATLAAGCVVSRDVPDYAVVGGVPARVLKVKAASGVPSMSAAATEGA